MLGVGETYRQVEEERQGLFDRASHGVYVYAIFLLGAGKPIRAQSY